MAPPTARTRSPLPDLLRQAFTWHRPLMLTVGVLAVFALVSTVGLVVDDRVFGGVPIWLKPLKFSVSLLLYALTLAWLSSVCRRGRRFAWWLGTVLAVCVLVEFAIITFQAARGVGSHFNVATPFDSGLYNVMGRTAMVLALTNLLFLVPLSFNKFADAPTRWAARLGVLVAFGGMFEGNLMARPSQEQVSAFKNGTGSILGAHSVGVPDGGPGLPGVGWSTGGGDLRIGHFVGLHAMQVLPLVAVVLGMLAARHAVLRAERVRLGLVLVAGAGYAGLTVLVVWQALRGQPLLRPDSLTLTALAALVGAVVVASALILASGRRRMNRLHPALA
ncbi:hypothetical protein LX15_005945 [Streptoalloteichus tenebrarius]|uniref:Uncharacterized protein n=1 Tax=Streptoalloteichus tenebrarius (strain ATCC 17920 / DSM 40477 / JCM 4838 / CBS 697.72 / NBRC 16177 / NCIMB 11028 / NRRL B-12390 / A12253. 1 / ISP 5477) TaxID=1933 RepID=A0ABT1I3C0_STRSD|nr:hypothetical protein [Streptoalloteichus tenebrarius]MCP2262211.1 hypothetical protein [Streptoalloteichus tenebrarius]BFF01075.1 hypothetical protein GCM10020241_27500 [Streptoalloteichus tenebrarius]